MGTGAGVASVWLLRGMRPDGVLTSVDVEPEHQRAAREALTEAGIPANRVRLIAGRALEVLPRLTDGAYDLVFFDADKAEYPDYLEQALRLLRPGGVVAFDNALWHGKVADPAARDEETTAIRELGKAVREDERLVPACCRAVTGCSARSRSRSRSGRSCQRPGAGREPGRALGHTDDLERLVQHRG